MQEKMVNSVDDDNQNVDDDEKDHSNKVTIMLQNNTLDDTRWGCAVPSSDRGPQHQYP